MTRLIKSPEDAERAVADWARTHGFPDAYRTPDGTDEGVDVRASGLVAQVKAEMKPIGRPVVQQTYGAATAEDAAAWVFSISGFTDQAIEWANDVAVALFTFNYQCEVEPVNQTASRVTLAPKSKARQFKTATGIVKFLDEAIENPRGRVAQLDITGVGGWGVTMTVLRDPESDKTGSPTFLPWEYKWVDGPRQKLFAPFLRFPEVIEQFARSPKWNCPYMVILRPEDASRVESIRSKLKEAWAWNFQEVFETSRRSKSLFISLVGIDPDLKNAVKFGLELVGPPEGRKVSFLWRR